MAFPFSTFKVRQGWLKSSVFILHHLIKSCFQSLDAVLPLLSLAAVLGNITKIALDIWMIDYYRIQYSLGSNNPGMEAHRTGLPSFLHLIATLVVHGVHRPARMSSDTCWEM